MAEIVFWVCVLSVGYAYAGYALVLWVIGRFQWKPPGLADITPTVTVIITAYNEERSIEAKLRNVLSQDYPEGQLDIIVASDGSTDRTDDIVRGLKDEGVELVRVEGRLGKTAAQNRAAGMARGEILVFTDATTELHPESIRKIVRSFADPQVGCVGGQLTYVSAKADGIGSGGLRYWQYERMLKYLESSINSLIGVSGCFYAARKSSYTPISPHLISDFVIALDTVEKGYRVAYDEEAKSFEQTLEDPAKEFSMRSRVILRTYAALWAKRHLMNPLRYPLFALQLISHKILRYAVPLFMLGALISNLFLLSRPFYVAIFAVQVLFYAAVLAGHLLHTNGFGLGILSKPYYLALANLAALGAFVRFLRGERIITWEPVRK